MYFGFVKIEEGYLDYLRKFDNRISDTKDDKERRKFFGVLLNVNGFMYYAPLTHAKRNKNTTNFDIKNKNGEHLGTILFNNMIPVYERNISKIIIKDEPEDFYRNLLTDEYEYIINHKNTVINRANKTYKGKLPKNLLMVCLNFKELEKHCKDYNNLRQYNELLEKYNFYTHGCKLGQDELKKAFENKSMDEKIIILQNKVAKFEPVGTNLTNKNILK